MNGEYFNGSGKKREYDNMQHDGDANDAKKIKIENPPSKVVHIRSLPNDAAETDIVQLGMPFGKMSNVLLMRQKNQGFLEFTDEANAVNMVSYFKSNPAQIRQKSCYVQFSNHKELKTDITNAQNSSAQAALQAAQGLLGAGGGHSGGGSTILRVIVDNLLYPVTLDVLHQLFSRFGKLLKMIIFNKNGQFQSLIQFADPLASIAARDSLDGQNIYNGCNTLKIDHSRMTNLQVKFNNDKSRDFTRPDLPSGDGPMDGNLGLGVLGAAGLGGAGLLGAGVGGLNQMGLGALGGGFNFNRMGNLNMDRMDRMDRMERMERMDRMDRDDDRDHRRDRGLGSPVILVSNFDEDKATPEALFTLFGVYGNVHRVKILFNKKDNALIQMADPQMAQQAIQHLDRAKLWGKQLRVVPSRHHMIQMPKEETDAGLTKDYQNSRHHRFKRSSSKNYIFSPTAMLHLYNVNVLEEDELRSMFGEYGEVVNFKFFNNDRKMALVEMENEEQATHALIGLHNYRVGDSLHMRVSFSKSNIK